MSSKLYFLKLLKWSGLSIEDLQYFFITVIILRAVSECACTVWNYNLTSVLSDQLESYQKEHYEIFMATKLKECLIKIHVFWLILNLLKTVESNSASLFSKKIMSTNGCLHTLLPPERNNEVFSKYVNLWNIQYPILKNQKYQSFLNYAPAHCCTVCLYCSLYVVYVLPIQFLGFHKYNRPKRLSYSCLISARDSPRFIFWFLSHSSVPCLMVI